MMLMLTMNTSQVELWNYDDYNVDDDDDVEGENDDDDDDDDDDDTAELNGRDDANRAFETLPAEIPNCPHSASSLGS